MGIDVVSSIFSAITKGMEALDYAQSKGYLGGSTSWVTKATAGLALLERGKAFLGTLLADPDQYDRIDKLPQAEKEAEIIRHVYPTEQAALIETVRAKMIEEGR